MKLKITLFIAIAALLTALFAAGGYGSAAVASTGATGTKVRVASSPLGRILVNSKGRTLYAFAKDRNGRSACSRSCASYWPPLLTRGKPLAGRGIRASLLGTTKRGGGKLQVTYNHHPLYTFELDTKAGQTDGEGSTDFGGLWYVLSPAGKKI
jgi:predicted lipoprotein with Yx(FWY)xxD motif